MLNPSPYPGHPFSRSYRVILPSSLTRVLSRALGYSPRLPVSVCGTGTTVPSLEAFLASMGHGRFGTLPSLPITPRASRETDLPIPHPTGLDALFQPRARPSLLGHPFLNRSCGGTGFSTGYPSPTPQRPRLRPRLTLGGRAFPRKPQACGGQDSHLPSRLLIPAFSLPTAPPLLTVRLLRCKNAPLPPASAYS